MSVQRDDIADTRPTKLSAKKAKKSAEIPVWLVGSGILLLSICVSLSLVADFLTLKGYITWQPVIPVAQAADSTATPPPATATVNSVALPTSTSPAATPSASSAVVTIEAATKATPTLPFVTNTPTPALVRITPTNAGPGNTYGAAECVNLVPDLLFVISETGKPWAQTGNSKQLDDFAFQPQVFQQISAAKPSCAQHVIFSEVNGACTPEICSVESGAIVFPDAATAKSMFSLIDQTYQSLAKNKSSLNWPIANSNAASCFSESSPMNSNGSAIRCTTQDGNSVFTTIMVSGSPFGQTFANAAKAMLVDNFQRYAVLANQSSPTAKP